MIIISTKFGEVKAQYETRIIIRGFKGRFELFISEQGSTSVDKLMVALLLKTIEGCNWQMKIKV